MEVMEQNVSHTVIFTKLFNLGHPTFVPKNSPTVKRRNWWLYEAVSGCFKVQKPKEKKLGREKDCLKT